MKKNTLFILMLFLLAEWIIRTMLTPKSGLWNDHFNADFAFFFMSFRQILTP